MLAAVSFDHAPAGRWNELVTGTVIAIVALTRAISPRSIPWFDWVTVALGAWLVATPLLLAYDTAAATVDVVVVGLVVITLALVSTAISRRARSKPQIDAYPRDTSRMG